MVSDYPYGAFKCSLSKSFCFASIALSFGALYLCPSIYGLNHLFSKHSPEVIPYLILMKCSLLNAEIDIVSPS
jgi:hypothetical protein